MRSAGFARVVRAAATSALAVALASCATLDRHVTVWRADDPGGIYPSGAMSGDPAYFVGWRVHR